MFNQNDTINFSLFIYNKEAELISSYKIPKDIDLKFKLPDATNYIEIKEYMEFKSHPMFGTILRIYIGKELSVSDLIVNFQFI